jgi:hypothetical protein
MEVHKHYSLFHPKFGAIKHHVAWPHKHVDDMKKYLIMLGNGPPRHQNMFKNPFSDMDEVY